jgi:hypothetical protein
MYCPSLEGKEVGLRDYHADFVPEFKLLNQLTHFLKTWCEHYAIGRHPNAIINFLQSVISI